VLRQYHYGFGAGGVGATVAMAEVRAGYFGQGSCPVGWCRNAGPRQGPRVIRQPRRTT
jgi:hypothetical protein